MLCKLQIQIHTHTHSKLHHPADGVGTIAQQDIDIKTRVLWRSAVIPVCVCICVLVSLQAELLFTDSLQIIKEYTNLGKDQSLTYFGRAEAKELVRTHTYVLLLTSVM